MANIGILSLHLTGHLNPAMALAHGLRTRGHNITFFNYPDVEASLSPFGFRMVEIGADFIPKGALRELAAQQALLKEEEALAAFLQNTVDAAHISFRDLPSRITDNRIDLLVIDQLFAGGSTVANYLKLPFISLAGALPMNPSATLSPPNLNWDYDSSPAGRERNRIGWDSVRDLFARWKDVENEQRQHWGLAPIRDMLVDIFSPHAQITQMHKGFDFPREDFPPNFSYVGPLSAPQTRRSVEFAWERLDGRPLIYASLGTMQNGLDWVFRAILDACAPLDCQLVLSTGGGPAAKLKEQTTANSIIVDYAPQHELLSRASLCITHAGLNTALDSLTYGVPMVAIPITHDPPAVASRIRWNGCGVACDLKSLDVVTLRNAIVKVMSEPTFQRNARGHRNQIAALDPISSATDIVEGVIRNVNVA